jgi:hypothetical protein
LATASARDPASSLWNSASIWNFTVWGGNAEAPRRRLIAQAVAQRLEDLDFGRATKADAKAGTELAQAAKTIGVEVL